MNDQNLSQLQLKLDRMARKSVANGLRESQMTGDQQLAYAYVWHEYDNDVDQYIFRKVLPQIEAAGFTDKEIDEAIDAWAECDIDPVSHCISRCLASWEINLEVTLGRQHVGDPCDIWFRIHGGNWQTLDKLEDEACYYQHRADAERENHPSLSAEQRNQSLCK